MSNFENGYFHDKYTESPLGCEAVTLKTCPRCGARLFDDMQVCYGCLFDFDHVAPEDLSWLGEAQSGTSQIPQVEGEIWGSLDEAWDSAIPVRAANQTPKSQAQNVPMPSEQALKAMPSQSGKAIQQVFEFVPKDASDRSVAPIRMVIGESLEFEACGLKVNICSSHA